MADAPVSTTPHYGLGQWNDGDNPGATALNNNWTICDTQIFSASQTTLTYSLPLQKTGTNLALNLGNNVKLVGSNLETIQNIRITDAPQFQGITIAGAQSPQNIFFMPPGSPTMLMKAYYQMYSASAFIVGTDVIAGVDTSYQFHVIGNSWIKGPTRIGNSYVTDRHIVTGSTYITGSHFSQEGHMWTRGNTIWGKLLARGETYVSGNAYFGEKTLMNGPLYIAPDIVSASNPPPDNTASWEDTFQTSQDKADALQVSLDGNVIPDPAGNELVLFVSGAMLVKGQLEIQGSFTHSQGGLSYDPNTGILAAETMSIAGTDITSDGSSMEFQAASSSFGDLIVSGTAYIGDEWPGATHIIKGNTQITGTLNLTLDVHSQGTITADAGIFATGQMGVGKLNGTQMFNVSGGNAIFEGDIGITGSIYRTGKVVPAYHGNLNDEPTLDVQSGDTYYNKDSSSVFIYANTDWLQITA